MAEIPYYFETPVPTYFRENGMLDDEHMFKFITWSFGKCQNIPHSTFREGRQLHLQPYEFIAGRLSSPNECFLTENIFRNQITKLEKMGLLAKTANSLKNHFTCYVWVVSKFSKQSTHMPKAKEPTEFHKNTKNPKNTTNGITNDIHPYNISEDTINEKNNQQNNQPSTNHQPTTNHKSSNKKTRSKESHHPNPSSKIDSMGDADHDGLTDDFFSTNQDEELQHNLQSQTQEKPLIPICEGVSLTQAELDDCIKIKGSLDKVKHAIEYIMRAPGRKRKIHNWPNALSTWEIKSDIKPRLKENEEMAKRLVELYGNNEGYRCDIYNDRLKDQRGLLFSSTACVGNPEQFFIALTDPEFKEKCAKVIRDKKMQKARISKS